MPARVQMVYCLHVSGMQGHASGCILCAVVGGQALEHTASILQRRLSNMEGRVRKVEAKKRKVLDHLLTLEGYWSGAFETTRVTTCLPATVDFLAVIISRAFDLSTSIYWPCVLSLLSVMSR